MHFPLIDHGGRGPVLHWASATGFPSATNRAVLAALSEHFRCVTIPPRPLWPDAGSPPDAPGSWEEYADDIAGGLTEHGFDQAILVGHSYGGVASLIAAARYPARVRALVLLDPTLLAGWILDQFRVAKATGWKHPIPHPLAGRARERRSTFATRDEAFQMWRSRRLFADWPDQALRDYVEAGLVPTGDGFALAWSPAWEAHSYESIYTESWEEIRKLPPELPVLLLWGGDSDTFVAESAERFQRLAPQATVSSVAGFGHLFPMAAPDLTARRILDWLDSRGLTASAALT